MLPGIPASAGSVGATLMGTLNQRSGRDKAPYGKALLRPGAGIGVGLEHEPPLSASLDLLAALKLIKLRLAAALAL